MRAITMLRQQHEHLEILADDLRRAVESPAPRRPAEFLYLRIKFAQVVSDYLVQAEASLSPRSRWAGDARFRAAAAQLGGDNADLVESIEAYLDGWSLAKIEANWLRFRADTHAIINMVQRRMTKEELLLFPLSRAPARAPLALAA